MIIIICVCFRRRESELQVKVNSRQIVQGGPKTGTLCMP